MVYTLVKIASALERPGSFARYLLKGGRSLSSYLITARMRNYIPKADTIIDVGANMGQFALAAHVYYPSARIIAFEPHSEAFDELRKKTAKVPNITLHKLALGEKSGMMRFYANDYTLASSALEIHPNQIKLFPNTSRTHEIVVTASTLDEVFSGEHIDHPVILKLDVQGFEKRILQGGGQFLKQIDYLLFEASFVPMYHEEPLFSELHEFVSSLGFNLLAPLSFLEAGNMMLVQADLLYVRA
jgi:FkbM family methyltransferase